MNTKNCFKYVKKSVFAINNVQINTDFKSAKKIKTAV